MTGSVIDDKQNLKKNLVVRKTSNVHKKRGIDRSGAGNQSIDQVDWWTTREPCDGDGFTGNCTGAPCMDCMSVDVKLDGDRDVNAEPLLLVWFWEIIEVMAAASAAVKLGSDVIAAVAAVTDSCKLLTPAC